MSVSDYLKKVRLEKGAGYFLLVDPDRMQLKDILCLVDQAGKHGVDLILIGSSILINSGFDKLIGEVKNAASIPVVIFPGSAMQISRNADAILFLSLISGRNPEHLIGQQIAAAPIIKHLNLESISTGYMLIESGNYTSVEFMSNTRPIPRGKPDIAKATALAAQYLGMQTVYLEAGSGAQYPVETSMVKAVADFVDIPIIVGGGIRTPEQARERVQAGASFIVTGNFFEKQGNHRMLGDFADAIHSVRANGTN